MLSRAFLFSASDIYKSVSAYRPIELFRPAGVRHEHLSFGQETLRSFLRLISIVTLTSDYCCCGPFGPFVCMW